MSDRTNRYELIVNTAAQLFARQGYQATSTRQIAGEVGCTEAALYYHFKDGKYGLLRAVLEARLPDVEAVMEACSQATSLKEALLVFASNYAQQAPGMRWIITELPQLDEAERVIVSENFATLRERLVETVRQFVDDATQAEHIAWLMLCIVAGYQQVFVETAFRGQADLSMQGLTEMFVALIT